MTLLQLSIYDHLHQSRYPVYLDGEQIFIRHRGHLIKYEMFICANESLNRDYLPAYGCPITQLIFNNCLRAMGVK